MSLLVELGCEAFRAGWAAVGSMYVYVRTVELELVLPLAFFDVATELVGVVADEELPACRTDELKKILQTPDCNIIKWFGNFQSKLLHCIRAVLQMVYRKFN